MNARLFLSFSIHSDYLPQKKTVAFHIFILFNFFCPVYYIRTYFLWLVHFDLLRTHKTSQPTMCVFNATHNKHTNPFCEVKCVITWLHFVCLYAAGPPRPPPSPCHVNSVYHHHPQQPMKSTRFYVCFIRSDLIPLPVKAIIRIRICLSRVNTF